MGEDQLMNVREVVVRLRTASPEDLPGLIERYSCDPRAGVVGACRTARHRLEAHEREMARIGGLYAFQREMGGDGLVVGVDEVGRGAVAGPLTVGAVILPYDPMIPGLDDSKRLSPARREELVREIRLHAVATGIAHIPPEDIDACGMAASLRVAMRRAVQACGIEPDAILVDGNPMHLQLGERYIVKGDGRVAAIAAASILAKVTRDALMVQAEGDYPGYHLAQSKGYASPEHIAAIRERGLTPLHRASFCEGFLEQQMKLL